MGNENTKLCETFREGLSGSALGMTLRDYFAAKALAALIAEPVSEAYESMVQYYSRGLDVNGPDAFAHVAYRMADAMLKAREASND